jgi:hypothetical protein
MTPQPAAADPASAILRWIGMGIALAVEGADTREISKALRPEIAYDLSRFPNPNQAIVEGTRAIAEALA